MKTEPKAFGEEWRKLVEKKTKKEIIDLYEQYGISQKYSVPFVRQKSTDVIKKNSLALFRHQITDKVLAEIGMAKPHGMPIIEIFEGNLKGERYLFEIKQLMSLINKMVKE